MSEASGRDVPRRARPIPRGTSTRREFLRRAGLLSLGIPATSGLLAGCLRNPTTNGVASRLLLASPEHPVTWPIAPNNHPIADNRTPERNATLQLYNYADYIDPHAIKSFEKKYAKYNVKVSVSTFNDGDEAITKIRNRTVPYDIYFAGYDEIGRLVSAQLVRPLNHTYLTNIDNVWSSFRNPWYDLGWQYTVPYTVYTTGIGWRDDKIHTDIAELANPYDTLWNSKYRGRTGLIDDIHTAMAMCLLRKGITDVNTSSSADLALVGRELSEIAGATQPKVTVTMYNDLPAGQLAQTQMWSGDVIQAQYYLPKGKSPKVLRYWFPQDGKGLIDNDLMVVLRGGHNPVLAHLFLQHMLETKVAEGNFSYIGYQPPQRSLNTAKLVSDGYVPSNLTDAVVRQEWFDVGYRLLELSEANDSAWHKIWLAFKAGR